MSTPEPAPVRSIPYAGESVLVLGECEGLAVCAMDVPPGFPGPPPHIHHGFDEAIYVLAGSLTMVRGDEGPFPAAAGTLILAPRGTRHTFANPTGTLARVIGIWAPGAGLSLLEELGEAIPLEGPPDAAVLAEIYRRHNSEMAL